MDIFLLSTFDGSPTCLAKAWVEELDSYLQQHHISKYEAIKVVALQIGGKAYAWWIFEYFSLKNENTSSYERFTKTLVEIFDGTISATHVVMLNKNK